MTCSDVIRALILARFGLLKPFLEVSMAGFTICFRSHMLPLRIEDAPDSLPHVSLEHPLNPQLEASRPQPQPVDQGPFVFRHQGLFCHLTTCRLKTFSGARGAGLQFVVRVGRMRSGARCTRSWKCFSKETLKVFLAGLKIGMIAFVCFWDLVDNGFRFVNQVFSRS
jgi:hypothetical protein